MKLYKLLFIYIFLKEGECVMSKDKIKGFLSGIIVMTLIFSMSVTVYAVVGSKSITASYNNIKIYVDQKLVTPKDVNGNIVEPFIYNGTTYLPVRAVGDAFGMEVSWDATTKSVYIGTQPTAATPPANAEYTNALKKAEIYSETMHMSKQGIYDQLTSDYGEKFPADAAQYAFDNLSLIHI